MWTVRIFSVDHYMSAPISGLDTTYAQFRGKEIRQVPVLRIFGSNQSGHKTCLHVHGVFPYIHIPHNETDQPSIDRLCYRIAIGLDKAINILMGQAESTATHIFEITPVAGIPFYGYHAHRHHFLKIRFYNPFTMKRAATLLQNGAVLDTIYQPHDAHINYELQFMIDYNLHGMNNIILSEVKFRLSPTNPHLHDQIPAEFILPSTVTRQSSCRYEIDCIDKNILNLAEVISGQLTVNPGIAAIWDEEKERRRLQNKSSRDLGPQASQIRDNLPETSSEVYFKERLREHLMLLNDSPEEVTPTLSNQSVYPVEVTEESQLIDASIANLITQRNPDSTGAQDAANEPDGLCNETIVLSLSEKHDTTQERGLDELCNALMELEKYYALEEDSILSQRPAADAHKDEEDSAEDETVIGSSDDSTEIYSDDTLIMTDEEHSQYYDDVIDDERMFHIPQIDGANYINLKPKRNYTKKKKVDSPGLTLCEQTGVLYKIATFEMPPLVKRGRKPRLKPQITSRKTPAKNVNHSILRLLNRPKPNVVELPPTESTPNLDGESAKPNLLKAPEEHSERAVLIADNGQVAPNLIANISSSENRTIPQNLIQTCQPYPDLFSLNMPGLNTPSYPRINAVLEPPRKSLDQLTPPHTHRTLMSNSTARNAAALFAELNLLTSTFCCDSAIFNGNFTTIADLHTSYNTFVGLQKSLSAESPPQPLEDVKHCVSEMIHALAPDEDYAVFPDLKPAHEFCLRKFRLENNDEGYMQVSCLFLRKLRELNYRSMISSDVPTSIKYIYNIDENGQFKLLDRYEPDNIQEIDGADKRKPNEPLEKCTDSISPASVNQASEFQLQELSDKAVLKKGDVTKMREALHPLQQDIEELEGVVNKLTDKYSASGANNHVNPPANIEVSSINTTPTVDNLIYSEISSVQPPEESLISKTENQPEKVTINPVQCLNLNVTSSIEHIIQLPAVRDANTKNKSRHVSEHPKRISSDVETKTPDQIKVTSNIKYISDQNNPAITKTKPSEEHIPELSDTSKPTNPKSITINTKLESVPKKTQAIRDDNSKNKSQQVSEHPKRISSDVIIESKTPEQIKITSNIKCMPDKNDPTITEKHIPDLSDTSKSTKTESIISKTDLESVSKKTRAVRHDNTKKNPLQVSEHPKQVSSDVVTEKKTPEQMQVFSQIKHMPDQNNSAITKTKFTEEDIPKLTDPSKPTKGKRITKPDVESVSKKPEPVLHWQIDRPRDEKKSPVRIHKTKPCVTVKENTDPSIQSSTNTSSTIPRTHKQPTAAEIVNVVPPIKLKIISSVKNTQAPQQSRDNPKPVKPPKAEKQSEPKVTKPTPASQNITVKISSNISIKSPDPTPIIPTTVAAAEDSLKPANGSSNVESVAASDKLPHTGELKSKERPSSKSKDYKSSRHHESGQPTTDADKDHCRRSVSSNSSSSHSRSSSDKKSQSGKSDKDRDRSKSKSSSHHHRSERASSKSNKLPPIAETADKTNAHKHRSSVHDVPKKEGDERHKTDHHRDHKSGDSTKRTDSEQSKHGHRHHSKSPSKRPEEHRSKTKERSSSKSSVKSKSECENIERPKSTQHDASKEILDHRKTEQATAEIPSGTKSDTKTSETHSRKAGEQCSAKASGLVEISTQVKAADGSSIKQMTGIYSPKSIDNTTLASQRKNNVNLGPPFKDSPTLVISPKSSTIKVSSSVKETGVPNLSSKPASKSKDVASPKICSSKPGIQPKDTIKEEASPKVTPKCNSKPAIKPKDATKQEASPKVIPKCEVTSKNTSEPVKNATQAASLKRTGKQERQLKERIKVVRRKATNTNNNTTKRVLSSGKIPTKTHGGHAHVIRRRHVNNLLTETPKLCGKPIIPKRVYRRRQGTKTRTPDPGALLNSTQYRLALARRQQYRARNARLRNRISPLQLKYSPRSACYVIANNLKLRQYEDIRGKISQNGHRIILDTDSNAVLPKTGSAASVVPVVEEGESETVPTPVSPRIGGQLCANWLRAPPSPNRLSTIPPIQVTVLTNRNERRVALRDSISGQIRHPIVAAPEPVVKAPEQKQLRTASAGGFQLNVRHTVISNGGNCTSNVKVTSSGGSYSSVQSAGKRKRGGGCVAGGKRAVITPPVCPRMTRLSAKRRRSGTIDVSDVVPLTDSDSARPDDSILVHTGRKLTKTYQLTATSTPKSDHGAGIDEVEFLKNIASEMVVSDESVYAQSYASIVRRKSLPLEEVSGPILNAEPDGAEADVEIAAKQNEANQLASPRKPDVNNLKMAVTGVRSEEWCAAVRSCRKRRTGLSKVWRKIRVHESSAESVRLAPPRTEHSLLSASASPILETSLYDIEPILFVDGQNDDGELSDASHTEVAVPCRRALRSSARRGEHRVRRGVSAEATRELTVRLERVDLEALRQSQMHLSRERRAPVSPEDRLPTTPKRRQAGSPRFEPLDIVVTRSPTSRGGVTRRAKLTQNGTAEVRESRRRLVLDGGRTSAQDQGGDVAESRGAIGNGCVRVSASSPVAVQGGAGECSIQQFESQLARLRNWTAKTAKKVATPILEPYCVLHPRTSDTFPAHLSSPPARAPSSPQTTDQISCNVPDRIRRRRSVAASAISTPPQSSRRKDPQSTPTSTSSSVRSRRVKFAKLSLNTTQVVEEKICSLTKRLTRSTTACIAQRLSPDTSSLPHHAEHDVTQLTQSKDQECSSDLSVKDIGTPSSISKAHPTQIPPKTPLRASETSRRAHRRSTTSSVPVSLLYDIQNDFYPQPGPSRISGEVASRAHMRNERLTPDEQRTLDATASEDVSCSPCAIESFYDLTIIPDENTMTSDMTLLHADLDNTIVGDPMSPPTLQHAVAEASIRLGVATSSRRSSSSSDFFQCSQKSNSQPAGLEPVIESPEQAIVDNAEINYTLGLANTTQEVMTGKPERTRSASTDYVNCSQKTNSQGESFPLISTPDMCFSSLSISSNSATGAALAASPPPTFQLSPVEELQPRSVTVSLATLPSIITPKVPPPSCADVLASLCTYNIPEVRAIKPFYSNPKDVTGRVEIGHKVLKIPSLGVADLAEFATSVHDGLDVWRRRKLHEIQPSQDAARLNLPAMLSYLGTNRYVVITPIARPPSHAGTEMWLRAKRYLRQQKVDVVPPIKRKVIVPASPGGDDSSDECLTLSPCTPVRSLDESTPGDVTPRSTSRSGSPAWRPTLRNRKLRPSPLLKAISEEVVSSPQSSLSDASVRKLLEQTQFREGVLYSPNEATNSSCLITGATLNNTHGFKLPLENLQAVKAIAKHQHLTVIIVELHVNTRGDLRPNPEFDAIQALFYVIHNDVPDGFELPRTETGIIAVGENTYLGASSDTVVTNVIDELHLLDALVALFDKWDPDIICGYEIETLSWGFLLQRGFILHQDLPGKLSRIPNSRANTKINDDGHMTELRLSGRIILDIWRLMRHEVSLYSYTFENVVYHILHQRLPKHSFCDLTRWYSRQSNVHRSITVQYYQNRVRGILKLLEQLDFVGRTSELARLFGIQFYEVLSRGSQFRVESMMLRLAKPLNFIPVSPSVTQRAKMKAPEFLPLILEPESQLYTDPVIVLDFQSLYPSMIIAYNYCFSTCLGRVATLGQPHPVEFGAAQLRVPAHLVAALLKRDLVHASPCGVAYVRSAAREGVLPRMLKEILDCRLMVKQAMRENREDATLQRALHARQLGLKLIANVTYGYTAANFSGRMPCMEVADSVVSKGRETLERAIRMVDGHAGWRARVVYGDTDSLFVLVPGRSRADAFRIGREIADAVTDDNPSPVKLKLEKVYQPCILQTKKRYVGYMYESADQVAPTYDAKGIETVRRDGCPAVAKMLEKTLRILFETRDMSLVKQYVCRQFSKLLTGRAGIQDLLFAREFRGPSNYRPNAMVPALEIARRYKRIDPRGEPRTKERVPYVIVNGAPGTALVRLARGPDELLADPALRPHILYYITKVIIPPLNRCLLLCGADVFTWFNSMPRKSTLCFPTAATTGSDGGGKKSTIAQHFATASCVSCAQQTRDGVCVTCVAQPQRTAITLNDRLRGWERTYAGVQQICSSCCGRPSETRCISFDCPVLYRLHQAKRDVEQAPYVRQLLNRIASTSIDIPDF